MQATAAMSVRERFHAVCAGRPVDRLPMVEWASWWDETVRRWRSEGLAVGDRYALCRHFGLDIWHQTWTCAVHWDCPWRPPHHGAGVLGAAPSYEAVEPYVGGWPVDRDGYARAFAWQMAGEAVVWATLPGFFWGARDILGIERHLMAFHDEPELLHRINDRLATWMLRYLDELDGLGALDLVTFAEDLSYNHGPMLSQKAFDSFLLPYYRRVVPELRRRGIRVVVDSDGDITRCAPWFERAGIEGILPLERQAGVDIDVLQRNHPGMLFVGHFDKMAMSRGEAAMRAEFERLLPAMRRGRFIPSVDHQTPPGVSLEQYRTYVASWPSTSDGHRGDRPGNRERRWLEGSHLREQLPVEHRADGDALPVGDAVAGSGVGGRPRHEDDGMGDTVLVSVVGVGAMRGAAVVEGDVAGLQGDGHARLPGELRCECEQAAGIGQVAGAQSGQALAPRDEAHAAALHRHILEGDPGRDRLGGIAVRPVGLILVELGGGAVARGLGQDVVVPQAQRHAGQGGGPGAQLRMQGQSGHRRAVAPDVDALDQRLAVFRAVAAAQPVLLCAQAQAFIPVVGAFLRCEQASHDGEAVAAVAGDQVGGEGA